jgi:DNA-binding CsgD family transcriptional regulator
VGVPVVYPAFSEREWSIIARRLGASRQQMLIMRLVVEEDATAEAIALRLGISVKSVQTQLSRLYAKRRIRSRAGLVRCACMEYIAMLREGQAGEG